MRDVPEEAWRALLRRHGDFAVAFQPDLLHFGGENGFLSYRMVGRTAFVLTDPLAPGKRIEDPIARFVAAKRDAASGRSRMS